jgi:hypothetical protein
LFFLKDGDRWFKEVSYSSLFYPYAMLSAQGGLKKAARERNGWRGEQRGGREDELAGCGWLLCFLSAWVWIGSKAEPLRDQV